MAGADPLDQLPDARLSVRKEICSPGVDDGNGSESSMREELLRPDLVSSAVDGRDPTVRIAFVLCEQVDFHIGRDDGGHHENPRRAAANSTAPLRCVD